MLYRSNILDYKSYLHNVLNLDGKTINNKLSALSKLNEYLIKNWDKQDKVIEKNDYIKIQHTIANSCNINKKDVEEFRQRIFKGKNERKQLYICKAKM